MSQLDVLKALAADCREQGDADIAEKIDSIIRTAVALCEAIRAERVAVESEDLITLMEARLATTMEMVLLAGAPPARSTPHG